MFLMSSHNRVGHPSFITSPRKSSSEGQLFAVGESASRAQFSQRMLPRVHPVDLALAVGMGHDDVVVLRPVDVALRAVASLPDGIAERSQRIVRRLALGRAAAVGDDVIGTRGWLQQAVVDLFVGIGNLAPTGLRGHSSSVQAKSRSAAAVSENIFFNMVFVF